MVEGPVSQAPSAPPDPDSPQLRRQHIAEVTEFARRHQALPRHADVRGAELRLVV
ncbi:hypothetical protein [Lentzea jiangxiensis]|uniref:hypothetical protein n=1 Tax=Lentzea jiangxiensis TaxID=641025 RepID=UPI0015A1A42A|nr:hypothetical protein [Lentzea jiangxiensis]